MPLNPKKDRSDGTSKGREPADDAEFVFDSFVQASGARDEGKEVWLQLKAWGLPSRPVLPTDRNSRDRHPMSATQCLAKFLGLVNVLVTALVGQRSAMTVNKGQPAPGHAELVARLQSISRGEGKEMQDLARADAGKFRVAVASTKRLMEEIAAGERARSRWQRRGSKDKAIDSLADLTGELNRALNRALSDESLCVAILPILYDRHLTGLRGKLAIFEKKLRDRKSQAQVWTESRQRSLNALVSFVKTCSYSVNWELLAALITLLSRNQIKISGTTLQREHSLIQRNTVLRRGKSTQ